MKTAWTQHLDTEEDKNRFRSSVRSSKDVLDRQKAIVQSLIEEIDSVELNPSIYDKSSWSALQAHYNGEKRAYKKILTLIDLDQEGTTNDRQHTG